MASIALFSPSKDAIIPGMLLAFIKSLRPKQWAKNVLLFAALVFDRQLTNVPAILTTITGFILFSLLASAFYLLNDLFDLEADRNHPKKQSRPLASGALPRPVAIAAFILLLAIVFWAGYRLSPFFALICLAYALLNLAYSLSLKHLPLIDVLVLASFYVLRVGAGVSLIDVQRFSPWLYLFTSFFALFLGIGKRRTEITSHGAGGRTRRVLEGYTVPFLDQLLLIDLTLAILTYSLYTFSAPNLPENHAMMLTIPFVIYGFFRYLYLVQVQGSGEAPEEVLFTDRPIQATLAMWGFSILLIFYIF